MAALITAPRLMAIGGGALAELPDLLGRLGTIAQAFIYWPFCPQSFQLRITDAFPLSPMRFFCRTDQIPVRRGDYTAARN